MQTAGQFTCCGPNHFYRGGLVFQKVVQYRYSPLLAGLVPVQGAEAVQKCIKVTFYKQKIGILFATDGDSLIDQHPGI